jgi:hypothetical protein
MFKPVLRTWLINNRPDPTEGWGYFITARWASDYSHSIVLGGFELMS